MRVTVSCPLPTMLVNLARAPGATEVLRLAMLLSVPQELETGAERMLWIAGSAAPLLCCCGCCAGAEEPPPPKRLPRPPVPRRMARISAIRPPPMPPARLTFLPEDCCGVPEPEPTGPVPRPSSSRRWTPRPSSVTLVSRRLGLLFSAMKVPFFREIEIAKHSVSYLLKTGNQILLLRRQIF